jgi:hypothetical protein
MRSRYQYRISDLLPLIAVWPACIAGIYKTCTESHLIVPEFVMVMVVLIATAWLWVGWFLALRISNGLRWDALWKRAGVQILAWLAPAAFIGTLIFGTYLFCIVLMFVGSLIIMQSVDHLALKQVGISVSIFSVSAPTLWLVLHLYRRAEIAWSRIDAGVSNSEP